MATERARGGSGLGVSGILIRQRHRRLGPRVWVQSTGSLVAEQLGKMGSPASTRSGYWRGEGQRARGDGQCGHGLGLSTVDE
ncbi:hypothetical protein M0R45_024483 [Rubus argutus]|uniref:Uncharacterized protein n=1 Tax=Rubus argutus TaxID=59490 RepID=A0AAW1WRP4_RUBAR